jgi:4,5-dihydroxyphthalate decarboxylase
MANKVRISFVTNRHDPFMPLIDGEVDCEGVELVTTFSDPSETFWRQLKFNEFQLAEMSLSSYLIARDQGADMAYLPVFPSRSLFWTGQSYHVDSGIKEPGDLKGKSIGVGEYQQTASLWTRGILEHDFGVSQFDLDWWMERTEELSHGGATGFKPMEGIKFHRIPPDKSLASMLVNHEIDAATVGRAFSKESNIIDRSTQIRALDGDWSKVKKLFPDRIAEGERFFNKWSFVPANHGVAIRGDVYREHPWMAFNLYKAFLESKNVAREHLEDHMPSGLFFGPEYAAQTKKIFGDDFFPYGVKANQDMVQTAINFSHEQGFIKSKPRVEDIFVEQVRDL